MKKFLSIVLLIALLGGAKTKADEGMWLPLFIDRLNYVDMQEMGLQLTAEEIYSINNSSLKDAIAIFGRGCTSEIISDQGLLLTNHHCGYGQIQAHSSTEHDYLKDGFWAMSLSEELPNPGLQVRFLQHIEDVTQKVLIGISEDLSFHDRDSIINANRQEIINENRKDNDLEIVVKSFFAGNEYYLFAYKVFKDVRFVGAPPSSIGKFGADTDNWMWPRHTGDFSLFRVYSGPDGEPAEYSEDNIPLKPKHHLPVSIDGVKKNDFSMILGYPGSTERYLTSYGVKMALEKKNQTIVDIRDRKLEIMREYMDASDDVRIKYASKYARTANYWKYYIGQTKGLKRLKVYDKKLALENDFLKWIDGSDQRKEVYGEALPLIEEAYAVLNNYEVLNNYLYESLYRGSEILAYAWSFNKLIKAMEEDKADALESHINSLREQVEGHFKDYYLPIDQKLLGAMLEMFYENVNPEFHPEYLLKIHKKYKGDFYKYAETVFEKSMFTQASKVNDFLDDPSVKAIKKDEAYQLMSELVPLFRMVGANTDEAYNKLSKGNRLFIAGLREMNPDKKFYPDANFTMRLTYGKVLDYYPADAVHFDYFTTLKGVMEKEDPNNWEFVVHDKLKKLYKNRDYGPYGENGEMRLCFLTDHDITGGNSGSPVINGKGELIGLAFDGNWEAMSGDIAFEPELQRTINVDIRYVLFIIDKFAGAERLIEEMEIVSTPKKPVDKVIPPYKPKEIEE